jgi:hypothetical protein
MFKRIAGAIAVACLVSVPAHAQIRSRDGLWVEAGLGLGSIGVNCASCDNVATQGQSAFISVGGTISRHFLLGGEGTFWAHPQHGVDETVDFLSVVGMWYPSVTNGFFLKFGVGGMQYTLDDHGDRLTATAPSLSFGVGYDFRVSRAFSVTPFINGHATSAVDFKVNGAPVDGETSTLNLMQFGVGFRWR